MFIAIPWLSFTVLGVHVWHRTRPLQRARVLNNCSRHRAPTGFQLVNLVLSRRYAAVARCTRGRRRCRQQHSPGQQTNSTDYHAGDESKLQTEVAYVTTCGRRKHVFPKADPRCCSPAVQIAYPAPVAPAGASWHAWQSALTSGKRMHARM